MDSSPKLLILSDVHIKIKDKDLEVDFSYVYIVRGYIHFCSMCSSSKLYQNLYRYCSLVYVQYMYMYYQIAIELNSK